ncbi:hypothetical protein [Candidatus Poriferisodalis sp.]|uniref:hypothetical protein n=1 Tax=Candidatus Poriferisodalis sp. TaxID=3101277 RepID=UPI003B58F736
MAKRFPPDQSEDDIGIPVPGVGHQGSVAIAFDGNAWSHGAAKLVSGFYNDVGGGDRRRVQIWVLSNRISLNSESAGKLGPGAVEDDRRLGQGTAGGLDGISPGLERRLLGVGMCCCGRTLGSGGGAKAQSQQSNEDDQGDR